MFRIMVVDDSHVDRMLIAGLLKTHRDLDVDVVESADAALRRFPNALPDLVVTDLIMPEMDGFRFVEEMKMRYSHIPVILMTAYGNESIAVSALEAGAASYVPKAHQAESLVETVRRVLARSLADRRADLVSQFTQEVHYKLSFKNDPAAIRPVIDELQHRVAAICITDRAERLRTMIALEEALLGAADLNGTQDGKIQLDVKLTKVGARFVVRGHRQEPSSHPLEASACFENGVGRGRMLMQTLVDRVVQDRDGDALILLKHAR